ncbi:MULTISPECIES: ABC transporter permease [unclassified Micromonospora]|uniref:ABC transporter permease n=1 Tax=unclassified Micromonospora TaxID=2617518 RepID=UPI0005B9C026|nr:MULTISPECIES: ABC transporter permease [unclassified Micromonospora]MCK1805997.1 ABC transporter permease [Micromonospora sp. R42106]MCK1830539.1 ABC transporter permease [Micromonospora sp. R42003]MCK1842306.1 ABC transporter permease [Micromonospora sp. R42004]MCM1020370.1 ABC transporter permease [Micromonospora sp. XM-20-01]
MTAEKSGTTGRRSGAETRADGTGAKNPPDDAAGAGPGSGSPDERASGADSSGEDDTAGTVTSAGKAKRTRKARRTGAAKAAGAASTADKTSTADKAGAGTDKAEAGTEAGTEAEARDRADAAKKDGDAAEKNDAAKQDGTGDDEPADPWSAFGPAPEPVLGRPRRAVRAVGRFLVHEWTLAVVAALALAAAMTWPTLRYPRHTLPQDYWDPSLQAWQMAWSGHILRTNPAQLWHSNTFYPENWSFAFSDTLLGYAPAGLIGVGPEHAVLRYNIMFVLAHALAAFGAYALARQLGAGRIGGAVAGASFAYAPWLLAQAGHLHIISNGGIPLALAMLARGHGWSLRYGYRPRRRHAGWAFAGWLVAAWQLSLGFGIGLPFAYMLAGVVLVSVVLWFVRRRKVKRPFGRRLFLADVLGGLVFAAVGAALAVPYFKVAELHPNAERTIGDIGLYSPPASGFFTAPAESRVWGGLHEGARAVLPWHPEMTLLPGFVLYALAAGGLFFSVWRVRHRIFLLAGVLVTMALAMGTRFFGGRFTYVPLFDYLPGWSGLRTPGRMMLWTTLLLGLLAAGAVTAFCMRVRELAAERVPPWPGPWLRLATLLPLALVLVEGLNATPQPVVPRQPAALRTVDGPMLVLPSSQNLDQPVMLWSTDRFQPMVNGGSGFTPRSQAQIREATVSFPDYASVDYLRQIGVKNVVVLRDELEGTPWEGMLDRPVDALGVAREQVGEAVVFRL